MATTSRKTAGRRKAAGTRRAAAGKKRAGTARATAGKTSQAKRRLAAASSAANARTAKATRGAAARAAATPATAGLARASVGTEEDLVSVRDATKRVYERLRESDPDALPPKEKEEYWADRHIARKAWESAENAAFAELVEQQKEQLPAMRSSSARLAKDVQATATVIGVVNVVSASVGILASIISLLA